MINTAEVTNKFQRERINLGDVEVFPIKIDIKVKDNSFLHIGAGKAPLTGKDVPVFEVDGRPVIPATSLKGAFRFQMEQLLVNKKNDLKTICGDNEKIKPCIPAPKPTEAERKLVEKYREKLCEIKFERDEIKPPEHGICPVCYFFGCAGLMGFLRIKNFWSLKGEHKVNQTCTRQDRATQTAAHGAILEGNQVKPDTTFKGEIWIVLKDTSWQFGKVRKLGDKKLDTWLESSENKGDIQKLLIEKLMIPALNNIFVLGGWKSKGAGDVELSLTT
jgi:CRISPR/Cas system CSM-associated protein Csm3 (group 7 of RAMP superfamily)